MRGDSMAKRSSFGNSIRKRLSDITNYQPQPKSPLVFDQNLSPSATKELIDHLLKENEGLMKLITEKNKVIELNGVELQKLRIYVQKTQLQNWNLAQSNSHMMAELNFGKKKLKTLGHELSCKDAVLKSMNLELQAKRDQKDGPQTKEDNGETKQQTTNKLIGPKRSQSIGPLMTAVSHQELVENKRRCVRRQSARFRSQEHESNDNLFEIKDLKMHENDPTLNVKFQRKDENRQESQRMSLGRPSRRAAEKIQSYKEIPLNMKMRRPE